MVMIFRFDHMIGENQHFVMCSVSPSKGIPWTTCKFGIVQPESGLRAVATKERVSEFLSRRLNLSCGLGDTDGQKAKILTTEPGPPVLTLSDTVLFERIMKTTFSD